MTVEEVLKRVPPDMGALSFCHANVRKDVLTIYTRTRFIELQVPAEHRDRLHRELNTFITAARNLVQ